MRKNLERLTAQLMAHGTCPSCIARDADALDEVTTKQPKEEVLPTMDEVRDAYREDSRDVDDPFDCRQDLF